MRYRIFISQGSDCRRSLRWRDSPDVIEIKGAATCMDFTAPMISRLYVQIGMFAEQTGEGALLERCADWGRAGPFRARF